MLFFRVFFCYTIREDIKKKIMKIEIVPEGNKTRKEKSGSGEWGASWILDTVFGSIRTLVEGLLENITEGIEGIITRVARRAFAMVLAVFGLWFLLSGFADVLSYIYGVPGLGGVLVGVIVFGSAVLFSALWKK